MIIETWLMPLARSGSDDSPIWSLGFLRLLRLTRMARLMRSVPELLTLFTLFIGDDFIDFIDVVLAIQNHNVVILAIFMAYILISMFPCSPC